jgi:hypothetical protein
MSTRRSFVCACGCRTFRESASGSRSSQASGRPRPICSRWRTGWPRTASPRSSAGRGVSPVAVARHLRAAAAAVHFAPAAAACSRSIEVKQRAARGCGALADQCPVGAGQELGGFACDERERCTHRSLSGPAALQFRVDLRRECRQPRPPIQVTQVVRLGRLVAERCPDEPVQGLAQLARVVEILVVCLGSCGEFGCGEPAVEVGRLA